MSISLPSPSLGHHSSTHRMNSGLLTNGRSRRRLQTTADASWISPDIYHQPDGIPNSSSLTGVAGDIVHSDYPSSWVSTLHTGRPHMKAKRRPACMVSPRLFYSLSSPASRSRWRPLSTQETLYTTLSLGILLFFSFFPRKSQASVVKKSSLRVTASIEITAGWKTSLRGWWAQQLPCYTSKSAIDIRSDVRIIGIGNMMASLRRLSRLGAWRPTPGCSRRQCN